MGGEKGWCIMRRVCLISAILLGGCLQSSGLSTLMMSDTNVSNLSRVSVGMEEAEVMQIMHCPYKEETVTVKNDQYDTWFYVTSPTILGQTRMVHANLTPLTFKNDVLVSVGWNYYQWVQEQKRMVGQQQQPPAEEEAPPHEEETKPADENEGLEKALEAPPTEEPAPPAQKPTSWIQNIYRKLFADNGSAPKKPVKTEDTEETESCPKEADINEKDREMMNQADDQNFDFW